MKKYLFQLHRCRILTFLIFTLLSGDIFAQYFGRNKVQYERFNFVVLKTKHFHIHHYTKDTALINSFARLAERWYEYYHKMFKDTFAAPNPLVIYENHPDFQQTDVSSEMIDVGTGGFTEGIKQRLVMPFAGAFASTNHVLGHEMAHVFQYNLIRNSDSLSLRNMYEVPLWLIEGMAEYLSIGHNYPLTAMWMRDAVARNDVPSIAKISRDYRYNPYRYGHAVWSVIAGTWGDSIVFPFYMNAVKYGLEPASRLTLGITIDSLDRLWQKTIKDAYTPIVNEQKKFSSDAKNIISFKRKGGEMNLAPAISPDGRYIVFVSERDLFSIELFLADAKTGKVIRKLGSSTTSPQTLNFIESSGSWSPDGKQFVYPVYSGGDQKLLFIDVKTGRQKSLIGFKGVGSIFDPAWSPDGKSIIFSGTKTGITDLYQYDLSSKKLTQLTNDHYAELHPSFSPDGKRIVFISDRGKIQAEGNLSYGEFEIFEMDVVSKEIIHYQLFQNTRHINPVFSPDGRNIYFISDPDGLSEIYRYNIEEKKIYRITNNVTGVSGLTELSPALSIDAKKGTLVFSIFDNFQFNIFSLAADKAAGAAIDQINYDRHAGWLPPFTRKSTIVDEFARLPIILPKDEAAFSQTEYKPKLGLDFIGNVYGGVGASQYGLGIAGGVMFGFSDMLERHSVFNTLQINGKVKDVAGQVFYINRARRFQWGSLLSHVPYLSGASYRGLQDIGGGQFAPFTDYIVLRTYEDRLSIIGYYALSQITRLETSAGYRLIYFSSERTRFYDPGYDVDGHGRTVQISSQPGYRLAEATAALVGDNSYWGLTDPLKGFRYRFEFGQTAGSYIFSNVTADARYYLRMKPVTFAVRGLHYGRYFRDADAPVLYPFFMGFEYFLRGYSVYSFKSIECDREDETGACPTFDRLIGSKVGVFNAEIRLPFTGPKRLAVIPTRSFFSSLALFFDAGIAWTNDNPPVFKFASNSDQRIPVFSTGISYRVNFFNAMIFEVYAAYPWQRPQKGWHLGFQIMPGW